MDSITVTLSKEERALFAVLYGIAWESRKITDFGGAVQLENLKNKILVDPPKEAPLKKLPTNEDLSKEECK